MSSLLPAAALFQIVHQLHSSTIRYPAANRASCPDLLRSALASQATSHHTAAHSAPLGAHYETQWSLKILWLDLHLQLLLLLLALAAKIPQNQL